MRPQFNYFATESDCECIAQALARSFGDVVSAPQFAPSTDSPVIAPVRPDELPRLLVTFDGYVTPSAYGELIRYNEEPSRFGHPIDPYAAPLIEISPAGVDADGTARAGRLFLHAPGDHLFPPGENDVRRKFQSVTRRLKKLARRHRVEKWLYAFPDAIKIARGEKQLGSQRITPLDPQAEFL